MKLTKNGLQVISATFSPLWTLLWKNVVAFKMRLQKIQAWTVKIDISFTCYAMTKGWYQRNLTSDSLHQLIAIRFQHHLMPTWNFKPSQRFYNAKTSARAGATDLSWQTVLTSNNTPWFRATIPILNRPSVSFTCYDIHKSRALLFELDLITSKRWEVGHC